MKSNDYQEVMVEIVTVSTEDVVRTSGPEKGTTLNWGDVNDYGWDDAWND